MNSIQLVAYLIIAGCLLPYAFTLIAKWAGGFRLSDNQHPRLFLANTTGLAARAHAVQQNSFESLPLFVAGILMAEYLVLPGQLIVELGGAYLVLRLLYGVAYMANWPALRSIFWLFSMCCPVLLIVLAVRA